MRDELRMTIAAYQTLYESSIAFGMRKALQADQGKADLEKQVGTGGGGVGGGVGGGGVGGGGGGV